MPAYQGKKKSIVVLHIYLQVAECQRNQVGSMTLITLKKNAIAEKLFPLAALLPRYTPDITCARQC